MSWLAGWGFRKSHVINPASNTGTNYQMRVTVNYGSGVDSGENIYLAGACQANFGDVRFTDNTGVSLIDYWMEKKIDGNYALFWIEIRDDLSVYDKKIYIYYGKSGSTSIANGDATFIFFDDFEVDLSKWTLLHAPVLSIDRAYSGIKSVKLPPVVNSAIQHLDTPWDKAVHAHFYDEMSPSVEQTYMTIDAGEAEKSWIGVMNDISQYEYNLQGVNYNSGINRTVGWHEFIVRCTTNLKQFIIDGIMMPITGSGNYSTPTLIANSAASEVATYWDAIFITKFIYPEPSHGIWGAEESGGGTELFTFENVISDTTKEAIVMENMIYSLMQEPINVEDILVSLPSSFHIPILSEDILSSSQKTKNLEMEDLVNLLDLSYHVPISSEDTVATLLAPRTFETVKDFITTEAAYPVIGGCHVVKIEGD